MGAFHVILNCTNSSKSRKFLSRNISLIFWCILGGIKGEHESNRITVYLNNRYNILNKIDSKNIYLNRWDTSRNSIPFERFKKRKKYPWRSATSSNFTNSITLPWVFFTFFKLYKWYKIAQRITDIRRHYDHVSLGKRELNEFWKTLKPNVLLLPDN